MKIDGNLGLETTFTVNIGQVTAAQMAQTPNQAPNGATIEAEMEECITIFLVLVEVAFAAPEPVRRHLVRIITANTGKTARELGDAIGVVAMGVEQRRMAAEN